MKKLTKLIFSCAAVAAVTAAVGTAALAADLTVSYDGTGLITIADYETANEQQTILVVPENWKDTDGADVIEYVNQEGAKFVTVPVNTLADGTYEVRIGGDDGSISVGKFTVGDIKPSTRLLGDVDGNGKINGLDASEVVNHVVELSLIEEGTEKFKAADVDKNGKINGLDGGEIVNVVVELGSELIGNGQTID